MAFPSKKLAESLQVIRAIQQEKGIWVLKGDEISRTHRERLSKHGFLNQIMKGWYLVVNPNEQSGESTSWYSSFWHFCSRYLTEKYNNSYSLSAEQSILIHGGRQVVPEQLIIRSPKATNRNVHLLFGTSLYMMKTSDLDPGSLDDYNGIKIMNLVSSLIHCSPLMFRKHPLEVKLVLAQIRDSSEMLEQLLNNSHTTIAGRLAGAFRHTGQVRIANDIIKGMEAADYQIREKDPFDADDLPLLSIGDRTPFGNRMRLMWEMMRVTVVKHFPDIQVPQRDDQKYLKSMDEIYVRDAYHSLSIERYQVTEELIKKVTQGSWDAKEQGKDSEQRDAMAARGYWQAMNAVKKSIQKIQEGYNAGEVIDRDHGDWYLELFAPGVSAGLYKASDLAGYRNQAVFISQSKHIPMAKEGIRDAMPVFFELLSQEAHVGVKAILGHFMFVYMHPYMDGNGRMARFLMNVMFASEGYPWTIIPVDYRDRYMQCLEKASVEGDIEPFAKFIAELVVEHNT